MLYNVLMIVGIVLAGLAAAAFIVTYWKNGTARASRETIDVLKDQVQALKDRVFELEKLQSVVEVLRGLVTQAAPVAELAAKQSERHEENIIILSRLEGSVSRIESKIMRGE